MTTEIAAQPVNQERFWAKVKKTRTCWEWTGCRYLQGYGMVTISGKLRKAHRVSWTIANGPIPKGMCVLHRCDNPPCVRPEHLFLGTQNDNIQDMKAKGRQRSPKLNGEDNPMAVLTADSVESMRTLRQADGISYKKLGEIFSVSTMTAYRATTKQSWRNL